MVFDIVVLIQYIQCSSSLFGFAYSSLLTFFNSYIIAHLIAYLITSQIIDFNKSLMYYVI